MRRPLPSSHFMLTPALASQVTRILFSDTMPPRAIGVEFTALDHPYPDVTKLDAPRALFRATAAKEVILSAGSMGSPHVSYTYFEDEDKRSLSHYRSSRSLELARGKSWRRSACKSLRSSTESAKTSKIIWPSASDTSTHTP